MSSPDFSDEVLKAVAAGQKPWRGLPNACYLTDEAMDAEYRQLVAPGWYCIGFSDQLEMPGDILTAGIFGRPFIVVRQKNAGLKCFHNVCRHRGVRLVPENCRTNGRIVCPYHAWTYGLDGKLLRTPNAGGPDNHRCADLQKSGLGLFEVQVAEWLGMVFVNVDGSAEPFETFIAPLLDRWQDYPMNSFVMARDTTAAPIEIRANWKLAVENYLESYHLPMVHPSLNSYSRLQDHYHIINEASILFGQGVTAYQASAPLPRNSTMPPAEMKMAEYVYLLPNLLVGIQSDHFFAMRLEALNPARTREEVRIWFIDDAAIDPVQAEERQACLDRWMSVFAEDIMPVEAMQAGRLSPAYDGGAFSTDMDGVTHAFHRWAARKLLGTDTSQQTEAIG
tara:strand:- start:5750 stop:6928 length:1179 start_codon:yes stop_codon:yes gene_type:complete